METISQSGSGTGSKRRLTYHEAKAQGICTSCRKARNNGQIEKCEPCRARTKANVVSLQRDRKQSGLCIDCPNPAEPGNRRCENHRVQNRKRCKKWYEDRKAKAKSESNA